MWDKLWKTLFSFTWFKIALPSVILIGFTALFWFSIKRIRKGDEFSLLNIIKISPNRIVQEQNEMIRNLNEDSKQKSHVLKILNQMILETINVSVSKSYDEFLQNRKAVYEYILHSIGVVLTKNKSNSHRVAIFVDNKDGYLKIHEGLGYSSEGRKHLRLKIDDSAAGYVFRTGSIYNSGNVDEPGNHFKRHPMATKDYKSLMCVPIQYGKMILGVLSIDGQEENSFSKDDETYLVYFANALASFMSIENMINSLKEAGVYEQTGSTRE